MKHARLHFRIWPKSSARLQRVQNCLNRSSREYLQSVECGMLPFLVPLSKRTPFCWPITPFGWAIHIGSPQMPAETSETYLSSLHTPSYRFWGVISCKTWHETCTISCCSFWGFTVAFHILNRTRGSCEKDHYGPPKTGVLPFALMRRSDLYMTWLLIRCY